MTKTIKHLIKCTFCNKSDHVEYLGGLDWFCNKRCHYKYMHKNDNQESTTRMKNRREQIR